METASSQEHGTPGTDRPPADDHCVGRDVTRFPAAFHHTDGGIN